MVCCNPTLYEFKECLRLCNYLFRFRVCSHRGVVIINNIALSPARLKNIERAGSGRAKR